MHNGRATTYRIWFRLPVPKTNPEPWTLILTLTLTLELTLTLTLFLTVTGTKFLKENKNEKNDTEI